MNLFSLFSVTVVEVVEAYVCILQKQTDSLGAIRWSLPRKERCLCQGVVAPKTTHSKPCQGGGIGTDDDLWFIDDDIARSLLNRQNWKQAKLDQLLNRQECCMFRFNFISLLLL